MNSNSLRIVIDGRMYRESGIGRYIRSLIKNLQNLDTDSQYFILLMRVDYNGLDLRNNFNKVLADFKWYSLNEQLRLHSLLNQLKPDLVHFPHFNVPIIFGGKYVVTIHDLIHQHFQMGRATTHDPITYKIKQLGYRAVFKTAITKSAKILVPSNFVKDLLTSDWRLDAQKIQVTYEGVDDKLLTITKVLSKEKYKRILVKFNIKHPYIFYVGNAHPHKNLEGLIKAFLELKKNHDNLTLVLSGGDHYFWQRLKRENQQKGINFTGFVSDEELVALYKGAEMFVQPSFEEGFGIPLLEAMACETAVVSSNAASLPEVGGDACLYFDPRDSADMVDKIDQVLKSEKLRRDLVKRGQIRYKQFSWKKLAQQTLEVYESCSRS